MAKVAAKGVLFQYESATGPSVWSTIPCVGDVDIPNTGERDEIDITNHDSPDDFEETIPGIKRTPTISVPITAWDGASVHHAAMVTRAAAGTLTNFKVTGKDTKVKTFSGYVKGVVESHPVTGPLGAVISIKVSGSIVIS